MYNTSPVDSYEKAGEMLRRIMKDIDRECMYVVNLDGKLKPINYHLVSIGTVNKCMLDIAGIFKTAILSNAAAVMILHNHPSGGIEPSDCDDETTSRVADAGRILGIQLVDHVIVGGINGYTYSYRQNRRATEWD